MLWRLRGNFRLKKEKRAALHSGQFPLPKLLFFSLGARTSLPPTTAGIVILLGRGEYSDSGDLFCGLSDNSGEGKSSALVLRVKYSHAWGSKWVWFPYCRI